MTEKIKKPKVVKSPNYPALNLEDALMKTKIIYEKEGKAGAPIDILLKHLNYSSLSGASARMLSALKKYNLIRDEQGRIKLTNDALDILIYPKDDIRYSKALRQIALNPSIYRETYDRYKGVVPSIETLRAELIREKNFNQNTVNDFINTFFETLEFAGLLGAFKEGEQETEDDMEKEKSLDITFDAGADPLRISSTIKGTPTIAQPVTAKHFPIPLLKGRTAILSFETLPIDKQDIENIKKWLELFAGTLTEVE